MSDFDSFDVANLAYQPRRSADTRRYFDIVRTFFHEVSHFCACIVSPCLRQCVHGAPIGAAGGACAAAAAAGTRSVRGVVQE